MRDKTLTFEMPLAAFSLYFACPKCGAQPKTKCMVKSGAHHRAPHVKRQIIAQGYQVSIWRLAGLAMGDPVESSQGRPRTHQMKRRSNVGWRRAA
jgi:hypothetical protein